jgi:hypothetical protein
MERRSVHHRAALARAAPTAGAMLHCDKMNGSAAFSDFSPSDAVETR